jgi:D-ribose pyranose/furanose isomerase RbsD
VTEKELLADCLRRFNGANLDYFITGSMASNYWGIPRSTHDIDVVLQFGVNDVGRVVACLRPEIYVDEAMVRSALRPPYQFNAIDTRSSLKIDFWTAPRSAFESEMFKRRLQTTLFGEAAWIATKEDVILHKLYWMKMSPSDRQMDDVVGIMRVQSNFLDLDYLRVWAAQLEVSDLLEKLLSGDIPPKRT